MLKKLLYSLLIVTKSLPNCLATSLWIENTKHHIFAIANNIHDIKILPSYCPSYILKRFQLWCSLHKRDSMSMNRMSMNSKHQVTSSVTAIAGQNLYCLVLRLLHTRLYKNTVYLHLVKKMMNQRETAFHPVKEHMVMMSRKRSMKVWNHQSAKPEEM